MPRKFEIKRYYKRNFFLHLQSKIYGAKLNNQYINHQQTHKQFCNLDVGNNLLLGSFHSQCCGFQKSPTKIKNTKLGELKLYTAKRKIT